MPAVPTRASVTTMAVIVMRWPDHAPRRLLPRAARRDAIAGAAPGIPSACGWPLGDMVSNQLGAEVTDVAAGPVSEPAGPAAVHGSATSWWVQGSRTSNPAVWVRPVRGQLRGQPGLRHASSRRGRHGLLARRGLGDGHAARRLSVGRPQAQRRALEWPALGQRRADPG